MYSFVSEELPRGISEDEHSKIASEQHMLDHDDVTVNVVDEIQRGGEEDLLK